MAVNAKVASAYVDLVARTEAFKKAMDDATSYAKKWSQSMREESEKSRAGLAMLSEALGVEIPRHLRNIISQLPAVSTAINAAFIATPILLAGKVIFETGEKILEFVKKNEEAAKKNAAAWSAQTDELAKSNAELDVSNDKLQNTLNKLEGKPQNNLKLALDEAKLSAISLAQELEKAIEKDKELLESQDSTSGRFFGKVGTEAAQGGLEEYQKKIQDTNLSYDKRAAGATTVAAAEGIEADRKKELLKVTQDYYNSLSGEIKNRTELQKLMDQPGALSTEQAKRLRDLQNQFTGSNANQADLIPALQRLQAGVGLRAWQQQGDIHRDELQQQVGSAQGNQDSIALQMKGFEDQFKSKQLAGGLGNSYDQESYWDDAATKLRGSGQKYLEALAELRTKAQAARGSVVLEMVKGNEMDRSADDRVGEAITAEFLRAQQSDESLTKLHQEAARKAFENTASEIESAEKINEAAIRLEAARGQLSPHLAALKMQDLHGSSNADYNQAITAASEAGAGITLKDAQSHSQKVALQQIMDAQDVLDTSWRGMIDGVFDELARKAQDTSMQVGRIASQMIDGLNSELAKSLTGGKTDYSKVFRQASESLAKTGIEKLEGTALKALGIGGKKADGSAENPFYVITRGEGGMGAYNLGGIDKLFAGLGPKVKGPAGESPDDSIAKSVSGFAGKGLLGFLNSSDFFGSIFGGKLFGPGGAFFGGGHALGGSVAAGVPIDVGELGRERFVPDVPGRIVPHSQISGGPSIGYVDARGTDPALSRANFQRALMATHQSAVAQSTHAMRESQLRRPQR